MRIRGERGGASFYATSLSFSYSCTKIPNGLLNDQQTVTNLNGLPVGTTKTIADCRRLWPAG